MKIEHLILRHLVNDEEYFRKVIPFLEAEYFTDSRERLVFETISEFANTYNNRPTPEALIINVQSNKTLTDLEYTDIVKIIDSLLTATETNKQWLLDASEAFCKDKAMYNAIIKSIQIIDGKDKHLTKDGIPEILQGALSVCFDTNVGHDYLNDSDARYEFYHRLENRIPFDLEMFNKITRGGIPNKTLNIALAGTGVGKSLFMCHVAAACLSQGKNVLYITLEMAEERIAERIDANLMNVSMEDLSALPKSMFTSRVEKIKNKTEGRLLIKEYPTASAHAGHFRALLNELYLKQEFTPHIIFIDYLNICASSRFKLSNNVNSYTYIKSIAEELRGLAVEFDLPIFSATQTTRGGFANSDVELTDTSESFGLPATSDFLFALIATEDLDKLGQILVKQLKNRYSDITQDKRFVVGIDRSKMRLYDLDASAQRGLMQDDTSPAGPVSIGSKRYNRDFSSIKVDG